MSHKGRRVENPVHFLCPFHVLYYFCPLYIVQRREIITIAGMVQVAPSAIFMRSSPSAYWQTLIVFKQIQYSTTMIMRKIILLLCLLVGPLAAQAQFEQGKKYVSASVSGLGCSYSTKEKFRLGVDASVGYFVSDCLMLRANLGYDHTRAIDDFSAGVGARYYFDQCGVYMGAGAEYAHFTPKNNDLLIPVELGYSFFINRFITLEPSVYYKMSLQDFSDNSSIGFRLGLGFYF